MPRVEKLAVSLSSGGDHNVIDVDEDAGAIWTRVDIDASKLNDDDSDNDSNSLVMVSRVSSPLPIRFTEARFMSPPPTQVLWPPTLPWFPFQNLYLTAATENILLNEWIFGSSWKIKNNPRAVAIGSRNLELSTSNAASINHAAAEIAKSMPESFTGEHAARMKVLASGSNPYGAKLEAFRLIAYQLSNNLIEGIEDDKGIEDECKFSRIIDMFRDVNLPRNMWAKMFSAEQNRTSSAFAEALFEASINMVSLDIAQALLEAGIDPNQPIYGNRKGHVERPIQFVADSRVLSIEIARILLKAGANVDDVTDDNEIPALHIAAENGSLEIIKLLVENGADFRRWVPAQYSNNPVLGYTPLTFAADRSEHERWRSHTMTGSADEWDVIKTKESESLQILRYLLSLHNNSDDHEILQDTLTVAAFHGRVDMIELLLAAGASLNEENGLGFTALETSIMENFETLGAAPTLIKLGANPNHLNKLSPLHIAAAKCESPFVQLLVDNGADVNASVAHVSETDVQMLGHHFRSRTFTNLQRTIAHLHTPLQFALHRIPDQLSPRPKTDKAAMILLQAGAKLMGGELVQAVAFDNVTLVQTLLDQGANINAQNWASRTALQACLEAGHGNLAAFLLSNGASLKGGELFSAFKAGQRKLVNVLLANGASLQDSGPNGESILEAICLAEDWHQVSWAIHHGPRQYDSGALCAAVCSSKNDSAIIHLKTLLNQRKFGKVDRLLEATAVGCAAYRQNLSVLKCLLNLGDLGECIVPLTGYYGHTDLVLNYHYQLSTKYETQFWHDTSTIHCSVLVPGVLSENWEIVQLLLDANYLPDALSLLVAIEKCSSEEIAQLISHGAEVNTRAHDYLDTPLQLSSRLKRVELVRLFLSYGANVNAPAALGVPTVDSWGDGPNELPPRSALQAAVEHGHLELIDMLLTAGADVNGALSQDAGATALQLAAAKGYIGIARQLLELGAEINAARAETKGRTALEGAAENGRLDMVQFLLDNGAKTEGESVWQYHRAIGFARRNGHRTISRLLEDWRVWTSRDHDCSGIDDLLDDEFQDEYYDEYYDEYLSEDEDTDTYY
ncbi:hypothetical protein AJ78_00889 [Emergomyces pasteurianus Ep9510]|uniref:Uncharacterized protein n=1 Tax=Emergomyces pasteurianus Ep9510 TaxID=1447872 RepID=A0A1J9QSD4_9EURO|nr:hypothetical protein AJ78_00889 [Emergomyces pasteurianus Ep9510]